MRGSQQIQRIIRGNHKLLFNSLPEAALDGSDAVGLKVWPASDFLISYLERTPSLIKGKKLLELGSGVGIVGIACGALGAQSIVMSDRLITKKHFGYDSEGIPVEEEGEPSRQILDVCEENIDLNREHLIGCSISTKELTWGKDHKDQLDAVLKQNRFMFDLLIGSDLTYHPDITPHLFWSVAHSLKEIAMQRPHFEMSNEIPMQEPPSFVTAIQKRFNPQDLIPVAHECGLHHDVTVLDENENFALWKFHLP
jgi:hypothetical protein